MNTNINITYVNNAASGFPKSKVCMDTFNLFSISLPNESRHGLSDEYDIDKAKAMVSDLLHIEPHQIFFTPNATYAANIILQGFLLKSDICLYDNRNHNSVVRVIHEGGINGIIIDLIDTDENISYTKLISLLNKTKPKLVCLTHVSNVTGSIYDIDNIIDTIKMVSPQTSIFLDSSQAAGLCKLDVLAKCDFVIFPGHKHLYSVEGAALIICKKNIKNIIFGGTGVRSSSPTTSDGKSHFTDVGTPNIPAIMSMVNSLENVVKNINTISKTNLELMKVFLNGLLNFKDISILGKISTENRVPIISLDIPNLNHEQISIPFLKSKNIIARGGLHCSPLIHKQYGCLGRGSLRFSFGINNDIKDINKILECFDELLWIAKAA